MFFLVRTSPIELFWEHGESNFYIPSIQASFGSIINGFQLWLLYVIPYECIQVHNMWKEIFEKKKNCLYLVASVLMIVGSVFAYLFVVFVTLIEYFNNNAYINHMGFILQSGISNVWYIPV